MLKPLLNFFKTDGFQHSSAVFPDIDKDRLVNDLNLKKEGTQRGTAKQPETTAPNFDHIEMEIIARVEDLRRRGLENYKDHRQVYSERLNRVSYFRVLVQTEANETKARLSEEVTIWKSIMVTPRERMQEAFRWRDRFKEINNLERPANEVASLVSLIGLAFIMIVVESAGNAYLFAQKNTLGLLGGLMAAFLVSVANVALSTMLGMATRYINCGGFANLYKKLSGCIFFLSWIAFALIYNSGVAHFRDAVERVGEWRDAGTTAIQTLFNNPVSLYTIESYVLFILGLVISIISFLKGYNHSDPYPGYAKVYRNVIDARKHYINNLDESIEKLRELREINVSGLRAANDEAEGNLNDADGAIYGEKTLRSNLMPFLEQCNIAANYLLTVYRDANKAARKNKHPAYFNNTFEFESFEDPPADIAGRQEAEKQAKEVSKLINHAIDDMDKIVEKATKSFYEIDELEGNYINRSAKPVQRKAEQKPEVVFEDEQRTE